jgi:hypothetical protein
MVEAFSLRSSLTCLHKAIDKWVLDRDELSALRLSPEEWKIIRLLTGMLDVHSFCTGMVFGKCLTSCVDIH